MNRNDSSFAPSASAAQRTSHLLEEQRQSFQMKLFFCYLLCLCLQAFLIALMLL